MAASILAADVRTAPEQRNDKKPTSATRAAEVSGENRKDLCTCRKPIMACFRDKTLEDMIARKSCPLQWTPQRKWPILDQPQNVLKMRVWTLVGALVGALVSALVGGM